MRSNGQQFKRAAYHYGATMTWQRERGSQDWSHDRKNSECDKPMREYRPNYNTPPRS